MNGGNVSDSPTPGAGGGTAQAVTCEGGFRLPKLSALVPDGDQLAELLARKEHERGE